MESKDDDIHVAVGYGIDGPSEFWIGENVKGDVDAESAPVIIAILRDLADAIEARLKTLELH